METIEDIVSDMRTVAAANEGELPVMSWALREAAVRIEKAAANEKRLSTELCNHCEGEIVKDERDRYRAALLTICTMDGTTSEMREVAIDVLNGKKVFPQLVKENK